MRRRTPTSSPATRTPPCTSPSATARAATSCSSRRCTRAEAAGLPGTGDAAMYIARRAGRGGYKLFERAMHEGVLARLELRADLQRAMTSGQLELHYQPVVRLSDGSVSGVEALLRWRH